MVRSVTGLLRGSVLNLRRCSLQRKRRVRVERQDFRHAEPRLVHFEMFGDINEAIHREKQLKNWKRAWKIQLIEADNARWDDLYSTLY